MALFRPRPLSFVHAHNAEKLEYLMKSLRSRAVLGLALGAAIVAAPLTAGVAAAQAPTWAVGGGGYDSKTECEEDGRAIMDEPKNGVLDFRCVQDGDSWTIWELKER
ncbi:hypothetical protein CFN78_24775 [Amycolatopsis antarctica]|uniref:Uncharacterized protein n=1 Tax=Amycolatopsis antarctica TaxID=1854586 RepID=A0A263CYX5_9PSEU|nr:hypothetical protein [Amycolatopsis antarctica]OZM70617.1 hypothetical protein CFN78_24775 [Amycolatopsis antarctica]